MKFTNEAAMAATVVSWLQADKWEVYQEVRMDLYGKRADIVAYRKPLLWVIECKLSFSLSVIDQAESWTYYAHHVSVAIPAGKHARLAPFICKHYGIGVICVGPVTCGVDFPPQFMRKIIPGLAECLCDEQKTSGAAGNSSHHYYTPFRNTVRKLIEVVSKNPGISLRDAIVKAGHHYNSDASARSSLSHWIDAGKIPGVEKRYEGKTMKLFHTKERIT